MLSARFVYCFLIKKFRKIQDKINFLVLNYPSGHWDLVKGHIENDEDPKDTAIRESKEETGITDIKFIDGFKEEIEYYFQYNNENIHKKVIFFLSETKQNKIVLSDEHLDFIWLDFDDAMKKITFETAKSVVKKANDLLQSL